MAGCLFCEILRGERAAARVFEDERTVAILDHRPLFPGHVLLLPREHYVTLPGLPADLVGPLFVNAQLLGRAVQEALEADGFFLAVNNGVSQSVPHLHVHLIPRRKGDGLKGFFWPRHPYRDEAHQEQVRRAVAEAAQRLRRSGPGDAKG